MDKIPINEEIYEQYVEAASALVMEQYAVTMREKLISAEDDAEAVAVPKELNTRCRKLVQKKLAKQRRKRARKILLRFSGVAAAVIIALFGIGGILFTTVDAVRQPIMSLFIEQKKGHVEITTAGQSIEANSNISEITLAGLVPDGYKLTMYNAGYSGHVDAFYMDPRSERLSIGVGPDFNAVIDIDTEGATSVETIRILSFDALLVEKNGYQLVWLDTESHLLFHIHATALSREEVIKLAEEIEKTA